MKLPVNMSRVRRIAYVVVGPLLIAGGITLDWPDAARWVLPVVGALLLLQGASGY